MTAEEDLLLAEYNNGAAVVNHIDTLRNVLTSFFLTLNGGVLVAASIVLKGEAPHDGVRSAQQVLTVAVLSVAILGTLFVATIARLRRIQIERFHISNRILDHVLQGPSRRLVPFSNQRLWAIPRRTAGSYLWTLAVMLPSAAFFGFGMVLLCSSVDRAVPTPWNWGAGGLVFAVALLISDWMYFRLSSYTPPAP